MESIQLDFETPKFDAPYIPSEEYVGDVFLASINQITKPDTLQMLMSRNFKPGGFVNAGPLTVKHWNANMPLSVFNIATFVVSHEDLVKLARRRAFESEYKKLFDGVNNDTDFDALRAKTQDYRSANLEYKDYWATGRKQDARKEYKIRLKLNTESTLTGEALFKEMCSKVVHFGSVDIGCGLCSYVRESFVFIDRDLMGFPVFDDVDSGYYEMRRGQLYCTIPALLLTFYELAKRKKLPVEFTPSALVAAVCKELIVNNGMYSRFLSDDFSSLRFTVDQKDILKDIQGAVKDLPKKRNGIAEKSC
jgi:hypothetical protein